MMHNNKAWTAFLSILLIVGCAEKETLKNGGISHEELIEEPAPADLSPPAIKETPTDNFDLPPDKKVGLTLKYNPPKNNKTEYVGWNVTELHFFKNSMIGIEGLEQLPFLETIVFEKMPDLEDYSFLSETPNLKRLYIDSRHSNIDWSFVELLPNLEVLYIDNYFQSTISIDLKNNKCLECLGIINGDLQMFPKLLNVPNSLKYLNLHNNKITSLPPDFDIYNHKTVLLSSNPLEKNAATPSNITFEHYINILEQKYLIPNIGQFISDLSY